MTSVVIFFTCLPVLILPIALAKTELPSFVKVCNRHDPKLDECVKSSILDIQPHLADGIPEMRIPSFDPLHADEFVIRNRDVELKAMDMDFEHFHHFQLKEISLNWKQCHVVMEIFHSIIPMRGKIGTKGTLLGISLDGLAGNFTADMTNVTMRPDMNCVVLRKRGKEYAKFRFIDLGLKVGYAHLAVNLFSNKQENDNFNHLVELNMKALLEAFEPVVSKALGEIVLIQAKSVFDSFPLDVLLPE